MVATAPDDAPGAARLRASLADHLEGIVELAADARAAALADGRSIGRMRLQQLLAGLSSVPPGVECVVYLDAEVLVSLGVEPVLAMIARLDDDHAAVVRAVPVTDALKRAAGDRLAGSIDRDGLFVPQPPHVVRPGTLLAALERDQRPRPDDDLTALLVRGGHAVRVVRDDAPPATLRRAS